MLNKIKIFMLSLSLVLAMAFSAFADGPAIDFTVLTTALTSVITTALVAIIPFVASLMGLSFGMKLFTRMTGVRK